MPYKPEYFPIRTILSIMVNQNGNRSPQFMQYSPYYGYIYFGLKAKILDHIGDLIDPYAHNIKFSGTLYVK